MSDQEAAALQRVRSVTIHQRIDTDRAHALPYPEIVEVYRQYAAGDNGLVLSDQQNAILAGLLAHPFVDNISDTVLASASDRMEFTRWHVEDTPVSDFLHLLAARNTIPALGADVHYSFLRDGNTTVLLEWDNDRQAVRISHQPWWNGVSGMFVHYDAFGNVDYAVKEWPALETLEEGLTLAVTYRTIYLPDHVQRWKRTLGADWTPYPLASDADVPVVADDDGNLWPAWAKRDGSALRVPVVHFSNVSRKPGRYGESDLKNVPAWEDRLMDTQNSIQAAERMSGYQMYWGTGVSGKDEQGNPIAFVTAPGAWHTTEAPDARYGTFPAGQVDPLIKSYREKVQGLSRNTRLPVHFLTGDWPSGEALLRAEMMLVDRVKQRMAKAGPCWVLIAHRAVEIANAFSDAGLDEDALISVVWADPQRRDPITNAAAERELFTAAGQAFQVGIPPHLYLGWNGYDQKRLAELQADPYYKALLDSKLTMLEMGAKAAENAATMPPMPQTPQMPNLPGEQRQSGSPEAARRPNRGSANSTGSGA